MDINESARDQIVAIHQKCTTIRPLVAIQCFTYNHEAYIRDALEGFVMQKTDFPFVAIVHEDVSTDKTAEILKEYAIKYPDKILPIFEVENQYSKRDGSLQQIMNTACEATGAKYIATCEGDDYWTDPLKLQKQIDLMESDSNITLSFHRIYKINEKKPQRSGLGDQVETRNYSGVEWFRDRPSQTSSFVYRSEILRSHLHNQVINNPKFIVGDIPFVMVCSKLGTLYGLQDTMSTYRQHFGGWTGKRKNNDERWATIEMQLEYKIFGKEYNRLSEYFAQKDAISYFLSDLQKKKFSYKFLLFSLKLSLSGTIKAFFRVLSHKNN